MLLLKQQVERIGLKRVAMLACATAAATRVRPLKSGAAVVRNTRRLQVSPASHHPMDALNESAVLALAR